MTLLVDKIKSRFGVAIDAVTGTADEVLVAFAVSPLYIAV
jgi:hypothetical protein